MYLNSKISGNQKAQQQRKEAGRWLASLRKKAGLSQRQLAEAVGNEFYTFISQIENGKGRIPPNKYAIWADAVHMERKDFVRDLISYYDPLTHEILFGAEPTLQITPENTGS